MSIEEAFADFARIDVKKHIDAGNAAFRAKQADDWHRNSMTIDAKRVSAPLKKWVRRKMMPHSVEFFAPTDYSVAYDSGTISVYLNGEIWPATANGHLYSMQVRAPIKFSMTPRDADEFRRIVAMLRAMADAATAGGL